MGKDVKEKKQKQTEKTADKKKAKKTVQREEHIFVQAYGQEWETAALIEQVKTAYVAEGHRASSIRALNLYIKPEERKAYYTINHKIAGSIDLP